MIWNPQQDRALVETARWIAEGEKQVYRIFGYAGVGKTRLAKHLAEGVSGETLFGAYTGKAAHVLHKMGCPGASTIHSMIYHSRDKGQALLKELEAELGECLMEMNSEPEMQTAEPELRKQLVDECKAVINLRAKIAAEKEALAQPAFTLNLESSVRDASLVVIDECSMVDDRVGSDLLSFGTKVLVLGDPAQLPPVRGAGFFTENVEPDVMLTEIHRQAADNPIIAMATQVRQQQALDVGTYGSSSVVDKGDIGPTHALEADQVLVGRNKTRHASNNRMRALLGRGEDRLPVPGDRLVCLRNNHEHGLLNGAIWNVEDVGETNGEQLTMTVVPEDGGMPLVVDAHTHYFLGNEGRLNWWERKEAEEFDYGYALTVHKAQGSQWDDVLLFDESYCFRSDRWRWLYTGLTRAAERVTVVRT